MASLVNLKTKHTRKKFKLVNGAGMFLSNRPCIQRPQAVRQKPLSAISFSHIK
jgi:hypothetical protein